MKQNILFKPHVSAQRFYNNYNSYHRSQDQIIGRHCQQVLLHFGDASSSFQNAFHLLELVLQRSQHNSLETFFHEKLRRVWHSRLTKKLLWNVLFLFVVIFSKTVKKLWKEGVVYHDYNSAVYKNAFCGKYMKMCKFYQTIWQL